MTDDKGFQIDNPDYDNQDYDKDIIMDTVWEENGVVHILFRMFSFAPDRTKYKMYGMTYSPGDVFVEVEVPKGMVKRHNHNQVILTPEGAAFIASQMAKATWEQHARDLALEKGY